MPLTTGQGLPSGQVLQNRYRVVALLGEGGMGAVYRAWDLRLEKPVALKEMVPQSGLDASTLEKLRAQFRQEAVVLGRLTHPNLVPVTDYFEEQGNDYLVMAFVAGESLAARIIREGALPDTQVIIWAKQLLDALAYCHGQGVIHRDIKPQNVVITPEGKAVLVDFGLVKLWDPVDPRTRTVMRGMGTPEYSPPEQWSTQGYHTDPRADLYSLGATLYHTLTGKAPPTASDRMAEPTHFVPVRGLNPGVSSQTASVIMRAMELPRDARYPSAGAMLDALLSESPPPAAPPIDGPAPGSALQATAVLPEPAERPQPQDAPPAALEPVARTARIAESPEQPRALPERRGRRRRIRWLWGAIPLLLVVAGGVLAGFGYLDGLIPRAPRPSPTPVPTRTPVVRPEVTPEAALPEEPTPSPSSESSGDTYRVALVIGLLGDRSFLDSAAAGIKMANEHLESVETKIIENADVGEQQLAARAMAEEGYDLIITVGFASADWTAEIANEYPDIHFAIVDSTLPDVPNGTGLTFREDEGSFTVGMAAAMLTKTGKVGFIGGMDVPLLRRFETGYIQGVHYVDPDIEVVSGWVGAFDDPTKGKELALTQYEEGADIVFAAAGKSGEGVIAASAERDLYSIGVDSDQCHIAPGNVIASMMKRVDLAVFGAVKSLTEGTLEAGTQVYGLAENSVGMCHLYDTDTEFQDNGPADMVATLTDEVIPAVEAAVAKIRAGEMCVADSMEVFSCDNPASAGGMDQ